MNKPTAQELWEMIEEEMAKLPELQKKIIREQSTPALYLIASQRIQNLQKLYAQTYHEEQRFSHVKTCIHCNVKELGHCSDPTCTNYPNPQTTMTKKYKLLINNSPEFPHNTIATEVDTDGVKTYVVQYNNGSRFLHASSVENRPTIWHEITEPEPKQSFKRWRAKFYGRYFVVMDGEGVLESTERGDEYDNYRYLTGNYFQTEQEAEVYKARQEAIGRVTHAIIEANEGWEPDWEDYTQKFYIYRETQSNLLKPSCDRTAQQIYTLPYMRTENIALSIISSHKEDLDLIFNLKK